MIFYNLVLAVFVIFYNLVLSSLVSTALKPLDFKPVEFNGFTSPLRRHHLGSSQTKLIEFEEFGTLTGKVLCLPSGCMGNTHIHPGTNGSKHIHQAVYSAFFNFAL